MTCGQGEQSSASGHNARRCSGAIWPRARRPPSTSLLRRPRPQPGGAASGEGAADERPDRGQPAFVWRHGRSLRASPASTCRPRDTPPTPCTRQSASRADTARRGWASSRGLARITKRDPFSGPSRARIADSVPTNSRCREAVRRPQNVRFCTHSRRVASIVCDRTFLLSWRQ